MRVVECIQGEDSWLHARRGIITASRLADVLNYNQPTAAQKKEGHAKGKESQKRADYRIELIAERLTGKSEERFVSYDMKWGTKYEPEARSAYEMAVDQFLDRVGFVLHPTMGFAGASPDGLSGKDGGAEFKCPKSTTHLEWMLAGVVPEEYIPQMMWEMACCERKWMDFVSFDPRMPEELQLFIIRLPRDDAKIAEMEAEVKKFEGEIVEQLTKLRFA